MRTQNVNMNLKHEPKNEHDYHKMFASQPNIMTHQDMSPETYIHASDQTIKNFFSHNNLLNATFQSRPIKMGLQHHLCTKFYFKTKHKPGISLL